MSGGVSIALVCPECGAHRHHACRPCPNPFSRGWQTGDRVSVTYAPQPGIDSGTFAGSVIRAVGRVARVHLDYGNGDFETVHLAHEIDGRWMDPDYGVPCDVTEGAKP